MQRRTTTAVTASSGFAHLAEQVEWGQVARWRAHQGTDPELRGSEAPTIPQAVLCLDACLPAAPYIEGTPPLLTAGAKLLHLVNRLAKLEQRRLAHCVLEGAGG